MSLVTVAKSFRKRRILALPLADRVQEMCEIPLRRIIWA